MVTCKSCFKPNTASKVRDSNCPVEFPDKHRQCAAAWLRHRVSCIFKPFRDIFLLRDIKYLAGRLEGRLDVQADLSNLYVANLATIDFCNVSNKNVHTDSACDNHNRLQHTFLYKKPKHYPIKRN